MLLIGLGNPGAEYADTRHNAGFQFLDFLAGSQRASWQKRERLFHHLFLEGSRLGGRGDWFLIKPMTYMNLSGGAVMAALNLFQQKPENIVVICDDVQLPLGRVRLRPKGSSGGQKGLKNIIEKIGHDNFTRIRIGVGPPTHPDLSEFVLGTFNNGEEEILHQIFPLLLEGIILLSTQGIDVAVPKINGIHLSPIST